MWSAGICPPGRRISGCRPLTVTLSSGLLESAVVTDSLVVVVLLSVVDGIEVIGMVVVVTVLVFVAVVVVVGVVVVVVVYVVVGLVVVVVVGVVVVCFIVVLVTATVLVKVVRRIVSVVPCSFTTGDVVVGITSAAGGKLSQTIKLNNKETKYKPVCLDCSIGV